MSLKTKSLPSEAPPNRQAGRAKLGYKLITALSLALVLGFGASAALANWTPPPNGPTSCPSSEPGCNLPVNVSDVPQTKTGNLQVNKLLSDTDVEFYAELMPDGLPCAIGETIKKVGIGDWDCTPFAPGIWEDDPLSPGVGTRLKDSYRDVKIAGDLWFDGEILPDGATCPAGNVLVKNADDDWGCTLYSPGYWTLDTLDPDNPDDDITTVAAVDDIRLKNNLLLPNTSAAGTAGVVKFGSGNFLHNFSTNNTQANKNIFLGDNAGNTTNGGVLNIGIGNLALMSLTTGQYNVAVGSNAMVTNTGGSDNIAIGDSALNGGSDTAGNIAIGRKALQTPGDGSTGNVVIGRNAMQTSAGGADYNVAVGEEALYSNTASFQVAVGHQALKQNVGGIFNTAIGYQALTRLDGDASSKENTALGANAGDYFKGENNVIVGSNAVSNPASVISRGNSNVVVGMSAALSLGYGAQVINPADYGNNNTIVGYNSGTTLRSGDQNTLVGSNAETTLSTSLKNVVVGVTASAGQDNSTAVGYGAIANASNSVALGYLASTYSSQSTAVGVSSNANGPNATALGYGAAATYSNSTAIGNGATAGAINAIVLGNSSANVGIRNSAPGDPLQIGVGGDLTRTFIRIDSGSPASGGCTVGQMFYDTTGNRLQVCGTAGWRSL